MPRVWKGVGWWRVSVGASATVRGRRCPRGWSTNGVIDGDEEEEEVGDEGVLHGGSSKAGPESHGSPTYMYAPNLQKERKQASVH
jgi:hypothetical protein